jgi:hypothetical protein
MLRNLSTKTIFAKRVNFEEWKQPESIAEIMFWHIAVRQFRIHLAVELIPFEVIYDRFNVSGNG